MSDKVTNKREHNKIKRNFLIFFFIFPLAIDLDDNGKGILSFDRV